MTCKNTRDDALIFFVAFFLSFKPLEKLFQKIKKLLQKYSFRFRAGRRFLFYLFCAFQLFGFSDRLKTVDSGFARCQMFLSVCSNVGINKVVFDVLVV